MDRVATLLYLFIGILGNTDINQILLWNEIAEYVHLEQIPVKIICHKMKKITTKTKTQNVYILPFQTIFFC